MLPEQRVAYKTWSVFSVGSSNRNSEKIKYLMNISPAAPFRDREKVTYESIMEVFNRKIVGFENMKHTIAIYLAENQKKIRKRGVNILIHGLPGTGKTNLWGGAIAEALHLHHKIVNLGDKSSTLSLNGCEAPYDNSESGILVKFFFKCRTSENVITWDELDKVAHIGEARGKDGHVMECLFPIFDSDRKTLGDAFLDEVPINLENTINICTANRVDNVAPELLNRMDMVFYMEPYDEKILLTIIHRNLPTIEKEYKLKSGWIRENALKRLIKYRSDFGARDIISGLKTMATYSRDNNGAIVTVKIVDGIMPNVVDMNNATVRFYYNEEKYSKEQKAEILETMTRRTCAENLSEQERRALDLKAEYLTKLIPNNSFKFDPDVFFKSVNKKLWGMEDTKSKNSVDRVYIQKEDVTRILGSKDYVYLADKKTSGCVNGLATYGDSYGLVMPIRVTLLHNPNGEKRITGLPEAAIRDSVTLAETWLEEEFGIYLKEGFHIHFSPAGIKKDGPSAGLAIAIALLSAATGICVGNIAMSGEFDEKNVLPVGGAALKTQAAVSAGINKVYLPEGCRKDIDPEKFENVQIRFVKNIDSVVRELFPNIKKDKYDISKKVS